jgi:drug/metabolite transporter (DMT)-like permease
MGQAEAMSLPPRLSRQHLLFAATCGIWGTTWIATKAGVTVVPPLFFAGTRFLAAAVLLIGWRLLKDQPLGVARAELPRLMAMALLLVTFTYAPLFWGIQHVSSGLAAVVNLALMPVALLAIGVACGEERFDVRQALAIALGVGGLIVLFGPALSWGGMGSMQLLGIGGIVAGTLAYALGSVVARPLLRVYAPTHLAGLTNLIGGTALLAGSFLFEPGAAQALTGRWGAAAWSGWAFLLIFGSLLAWVFYLRLLRDWGPVRAGTYAFISPTIAVLLGILVFDERLTVSDVVGMAIMLSAAWLAHRARAAALTGLPKGTLETPAGERTA